jgi:hypothetical protein
VIIIIEDKFKLSQANKPEYFFTDCEVYAFPISHPQINADHITLGSCLLKPKKKLQLLLLSREISEPTMTVIIYSGDV